jgi:(2R)-ethylmalonyl-CoA mutase
MKRRLVESNARRLAAIEAGEQVVVGVNRWRESAPSPLAVGEGGGIVSVDEGAERRQVDRLREWRRARDGALAAAALANLEAAAAEGRNIMEPSIACAHAGVTTGEWGAALRKTFGEYRAPTGVARAAPPANAQSLDAVRIRVDEVSRRLGRRLKILVGKPGLDGHSNGAEQVAVRARDAGFEVVYEGIRLTPARIVNAALEEGVHLIGLSILSGSHGVLVTEVLDGMRAAGLGTVPVVVGGIIPPDDERRLIAEGVARVYTPKHYDLTQIMSELVEIIDHSHRDMA